MRKREEEERRSYVAADRESAFRPDHARALQEIEKDKERRHDVTLRTACMNCLATILENQISVSELKENSAEEESRSCPILHPSLPPPSPPSPRPPPTRACFPLLLIFLLLTSPAPLSFLSSSLTAMAVEVCRTESEGVCSSQQGTTTPSSWPSLTTSSTLFADS
eukprot:371830-Hanusia_phi.AAC.1